MPRRGRAKNASPDSPVHSFEWWGPHDRERRSAQLLLGAVAIICGAYLGAAILAVTIAIRLSELGPWRSLVSWQHRLGSLGLIALAILHVVGAAALIAVAAWAGLARRSLRLAGARAPAADEADHAQQTIETFALGVGLPTPALCVVDDDAPNGFAAGRWHACSACLTTGALALPQDQVDALCAHTLTCVTNSATPLACAAADLVLVADWCTRAIWAISGVIIASALVGVPPEFIAVTTLAIVLLVASTKPLLAVADRAIVRLLDRAARLADLDTVRVTNQPAALARLLMTAAADDRRVATHWQIAHLWFDPDTSRAATLTRRERFLAWANATDPMISDAVLRKARAARRGLVDRARVIVELTSRDAKLIAQLEQLERVGRR